MAGKQGKGGSREVGEGAIRGVSREAEEGASRVGSREAEKGARWPQGSRRRREPRCQQKRARAEVSAGEGESQGGSREAGESTGWQKQRRARGGSRGGREMSENCLKSIIIVFVFSILHCACWHAHGSPV